MVHMLRLWLRNRRRTVGAVAMALLALVMIALLVLDRSAYGVTALGNAAAPRPIATANGSELLPRSSDPQTQPGMLPDGTASILDTPALASAEPQDLAAAQAAWSAAAIVQHQQALLDAITCVRQQRGQPPLTFDPALAQVAGTAWLKLMHDRRFSLMQLPGTYASRSVVALDVDRIDNTDSAMLPSQEEHGRSPCQLDGLEVALPTFGTRATRVGFVVFPPQATWDSPSAVILV